MTGVLAALDGNARLGRSPSPDVGPRKQKKKGSSSSRGNNGGTARRGRSRPVIHDESDTEDEDEDDDEDFDDGRENEDPDDEEGYLSPLVDEIDADDDDEDDDRERSLTYEEAKRLRNGGGVVGDSQTEEGSQSQSQSQSQGGTKKKKQRRRRRSSARFLRLSGRFDDDDVDDVDDAALTGSQDKTELGEMYQRAIRMNAENKINPTNSWGFKLIENIDRFIADDDHDGDHHGDGAGSGAAVAKAAGGSANSANADEEKRVNFTRASCTIDASVKIYSYRVDDVYLTSYKVLANLNRTDTGKKNGGSGDGDNEEGDADGGRENPSTVGGTKQSEKRGVAETLETNVASLNMSKLDSAYDIDPLFHKMSKKFDEGGARGLLLNVLGVASDGCAVVFDSKEDGEENEGEMDVVPPENDAEAEKTAASEEGGEAEIKEGDDPAATTDDGEDEGTEAGEKEEANVPKSGEEDSSGTRMIDISSLQNRLRALLRGSTVRSVPLVPQLAPLREELLQLESEGFVDDRQHAPRPRSATYANPVEDEEEAEKSIHREALERSRLSAAATGANNVTFGTSFGDDDGDDYAAPDFGGGDDDDDDGYEGGGDAYSNLIDAGDNGAKFSSVSFTDGTTFEDRMSVGSDRKAPAVQFLDTICDGDAFKGDTEYGYFDSAALEKAMSGNAWAGAAHWKRGEKIRNRNKPKKSNDEAESKKKKTAGKKKKKESSYIDLYAELPSTDIFAKPPKSKRGRADPLQQTEAAKRKNLKNDNLLPFDSGVGIEQLSRLFLRPNAQLRQAGSEAQKPRKSVGFYDVNPDADMVFDDGVDESFGGDDGDDDGPGFNFGGDSVADDDVGDADYVVKSLDGVRKVEKVKVGYATVAKKVDVKRLKHEVWSELDNRISSTKKPGEDDDGGNSQTDTEGDENVVAEDSDPAGREMNANPEDGDPDTRVSFKQLVDDIDAGQSQGDVTVPFYFIVALHLANEKTLKLDASDCGLSDFYISMDDGSGSSDAGEAVAPAVVERVQRAKSAVASYGDGDETESEGETESDNDFA